MSYTPTNWKAGDVITSEKLNKLENGIANAGGGALIVSMDMPTGVLDKTWAEINAAAPLVWISKEGGFMPIVYCGHDDGTYYVSFAEYFNTMVFHDFTADSESGYPVEMREDNH